ncbi:MDR family MFS transporter [Leifsonia sp. Root112D2]|uniref:MDR family MFS transporter n=1 Tax=Leifsonia sp. Root112D2 TaxID=1736426 RepID=UPI0006F5A9C5|nr:MDR family MFS transporter [Leifsonia sp. Root112D2]KQV06489.1 MFS transporter permease [Leifsonia sp. Root112D2]
MSSENSAQTAPGSGAIANVVMNHRQILFVIFGLMAGMFLSALDQTVVGTAIRTIGDDLHGLSLQAWVTTAYLIVSTISTPIYGKLSDIFGRRPLFIFAIVIFIVGSVLSSFSTSMIELAGFRALQGLGAGGLMSMPLAIMGDMLAPRERAKYQGYFLAVFGVSSVIGPLIGGLFSGTDQILWIAGWRWVFLINVPIGIAALAMVMRFLHLPKVDRHSVRIDWWGAAAVIVALVPLLLVAEEGQTWGWTSPLAIGSYVVGVVGVIAFILIEIRMKDDALIPIKLFRSSTFSMATIIGVLVGFGMFGAMMTIPLYLQIVLGSTPTESGFQMLPMILGLMIASIGSGQLIARTGKYRMFPILGTGLMSAGFLYLTFLRYDSSFWFVAGGMLLIGLGLGQLMQTLTIASQNSVGLRDMGVATSASTFFRQIGGTLGTAVMLSLLFTIMPLNIQSSLTDSSSLKSALNAAMTPSVASDPGNAKIMKLIYSKLVTPIEKGAQEAAHAAGVKKLVATGVPQATAETSVPAQPLDFSDQGVRSQVIDQVAPAIAKNLKEAKGTSSVGGSSAINDTSFLNGADPRLTKPFLTGFTASSIAIYWLALMVVILAFVLALFFKTPPLRAKSALQEAADQHAQNTADAEVAAERESVLQMQSSADRMGTLMEPGTHTSEIPAQDPHPLS